MTHRVFFSFYHKEDALRTFDLRHIDVIEGNHAASDSAWEAVIRGRERAIQKWIDDEMEGRDCAIVLIGAETAGRKWINYEIKKAWADHKGLLGIYVHNLADGHGLTGAKGANPFAKWTIGADKKPLTDLVMTYDPVGADSKQVQKYIADNIAGWVDAAVKARTGSPSTAVHDDAASS